MNLIAIDPGNTHSAVCVLDKESQPTYAAIVVNDKLFDYLHNVSIDSELSCEMIASYGMGVGKSVFDTCLCIGRILEICEHNPHIVKVYLITRVQVKMEISYNPRANDTAIRQALIDLYGGKEVAMGAVKCPKCKGKGWVGRGRPTCEACGGEGWETPPGPLHGFASDMWAALGVGIATKRIQDRGADKYFYTI